MKNKRPKYIQHFEEVDCFFFGMYGDCSYKGMCTKDENGVCVYTELPCSPSCSECLHEGGSMKPVGSTEGVWRYAHPADVGLFLDGTYGWFLRYDDYLDWDPIKLKDWLNGKPYNIYRPTADGKPMIVPRRGYVRKPKERVWG